MATTKTEQNIQKPVLPQSAVYNNLKQSIITAINQSGIPAWALVDMLTNITLGVQTASEQATNAEIEVYNDQLKAYNEQEEKKRSETSEPEEK